ncbi:MAG: hypothetical protein IPH10_14505 [bacterium]|nr:hypothetical protein [bacterium]
MNYTDDQQTFNNDLTNPAQVVLLASGLLHNFGTRVDNYAVQNSDGSYYAQNRELTLSAIQDHIEGKTTIGAYSLDQENRVKYVTLDIDLAKSKIDQIEEFKPVLADTAKRVVAECRALGIEPILEFSGFKGYHVTVLFEELIPAIQAKRFGETIVQRVGQLPDHLHIEVFPKQDVLTPTQPLGNLVKLPLALHKVSKQRSCFLNADTFEPVEDPLEFLRNAPKTAATQVLEVVGSAPPSKSAERISMSSSHLQLDQPGLERMVEHCPIIRKFEDNPCGWQHDPWLGLASNYRVFAGGWERFTELCKREPERFDQDRLDHLFNYIAENWNGPQGYDKFRDQGLKFDLPAGAPKAPAGWAAKGRKPSSVYSQIGWADCLSIRTDDTWIETDLGTLKDVHLNIVEEVTVVCPACSSQTALARLDEFHFAHIWCEKCNKAYFEHPVTPGMFAFKGELHRIETRANKYISPELLKKEHFRNQEDFEYAKRAVFNNPKLSFSSDDFQLRRIGSADSEKIGYAFEPEENAIILRYPAIPAKIQDNALINRFLEELFGEHAEFIKNWLAVYTYTNYQQLPVIVLAGSRSAGKNTFADMVGKIYPKLLGLWDGDVKPFNPQYTNKLLFVDENRNSHKPEQYAELKRITGSDKLSINKKYESEFNAPNNLNLIFATNDPKPIALKWGEGPRSEKVNNFFIHYCKEVPDDKIDREIKFKLEDRLGHYVRTELKERFEHLSKNRDPRNRYFLAAPITPLADDLYASSMTSVEMEAEELAEILVMGRHETVTNVKGYTVKVIWYDPTEYRDEFYVKLQDIRAAINFLGLRSTSTIKAYTEALVRMGVISMRSDHKNNKQQLGFKILRPKSYYVDPKTDDQAKSEESDNLPF